MKRRPKQLRKIREEGAANELQEAAKNWEMVQRGVARGVDSDIRNSSGMDMFERTAQASDPEARVERHRNSNI